MDPLLAYKPDNAIVREVLFAVDDQVREGDVLVILSRLGL